jgi:patatin-like phospholipase/acyl hydrolase
LYACYLFRDQLKHRPAKNALLSDIAISTSAVPTFFPAHYFETIDENGRRRAFPVTVHKKTVTIRQ